MDNIQQLLESSDPYKKVSTESKRLVTKWNRSGLLAEMTNETEINNMAMLLENQSKQLVLENNATNYGGASFTGGAGEQWSGVALPLVRRVFGNIVSKDFVSVQPMNLPSGLVFYLDFKYGNSKAPFSSGDSLFSATEDQKSTDLTKGLYGVGRYGYSINNATSSSAVAAGSITSASFKDVNFESSLSASQAAGELHKITVNAPADFDTLGVRGFTLTSGSTVTQATNLPAFTTSDATTITFVVTGSAGSGSAVAGNYTITYQKQTKDNARGDFEDGSEFSQTNPIEIPTIDIKLRSESIVAKTRKLKAQYTPEFAQDLNAYQSVDAESELTSMLSEYISMEIDLEILEMLMEAVPKSTTEYWSAANNQFINAGQTGFDQQSAGTGGFYNSQGQWFQTLGTKLQKVSNKIHQLTLRGGANFMVVSPTVSTIIESIPGFAADSSGDKDTYAMGVQKIGSLNSRYKVYKNPYITENRILMGYRGSQFLETGAVFAPYIPLIMTPLVYDPETFTPRKGLMTRYAKKLIRGEYYGSIFIGGLNTI